jgi:hypothetical protein
MKKGERQLKRKTFIPLLAAGGAAIAVGVGLASSDGPVFSDVPANVKASGYAPANVLSTQLRDQLVAEGSTRLENPDGIVTNYGYQNDVPSADDPTVPQMTPTAASAHEAKKTEPDKNTYLVLKNQTGADPNYDYGTHFLYQGHEVGVSGASYITRINLDADDQHRVTLIADKDATGAPILGIDGSTWDPFAQKLLFTTENSNGAEYAATLSVPSVVTDISGAIGRGGYEGIQNDSDGNLWIVEDVGGATKPGTVKAKAPNSFVYRFVPASKDDVSHGKLQVLQVVKADGTPITFESQATFPSADQIALHAYGNTFTTKWITIHDTAVNGTAPFSANAAAKAAHGTPFKRPENGVFRPGTHFGEFYFTETGDTDATSSENPGGQGGWGGLYKVVQSDPSASTGKISVFYQGDRAHTGLDNIQFVSKDQLLAVEDAGDTLHTQRKALDSGFEWDVNTDYSNPGNQPVRFLAEGRDAAATLDVAFGGFGTNEGDNEITGIHVSNGDAGPGGILGAKSPQFGNDPKWRMFWTQQHGENRTWEVTVASKRDNGDD